MTVTTLINEFGVAFSKTDDHGIKFYVTEFDGGLGAISRDHGDNDRENLIFVGFYPVEKAIEKVKFACRFAKQKRPGEKIF